MGVGGNPRPWLALKMRSSSGCTANGRRSTRPVFVVAGRLHLWSAGSGALRPVNDDWPEPHEGAGQVWLREHALAPWVIDCILQEDRDGLWLSRRDPENVGPLAEVTWIGDDGNRYLTPENALLHKAKLHREKDDADIAVTWPLLDRKAQIWLRDAVRRLHPGHAWLTTYLA